MTYTKEDYNTLKKLQYIFGDKIQLSWYKPCSDEDGEEGAIFTIKNGDFNIIVGSPKNDFNFTVKYILNFLLKELDNIDNLC